MINIKLCKLVTCLFLSLNGTLFSQTKPDTLRYKPFEWRSEAPSDCPFRQSEDFKGIRLLGLKKWVSLWRYLVSDLGFRQQFVFPMD